MEPSATPSTPSGPDPGTGPIPSDPVAVLIPDPESEPPAPAPAERPGRRPASPPSFYGLAPAEVQERLVEAGWQGFRARQVLDWVYRKRVRDPGAMSNLSKEQRARLGEIVDL